MLFRSAKKMFSRFNKVPGSVADTIEGTLEKNEKDAALQEAVSKQGTIADPNLRAEAPELKRIGDEYDLPTTPVHFYSTPGIQQGTDALVSNSSTMAGQRTQNLFRRGYNKAMEIVGQIVPEKPPTMNEAGGTIKSILSGQIEEENKY